MAIGIAKLPCPYCGVRHRVDGRTPAQRMQCLVDAAEILLPAIERTRILIQDGAELDGETVDRIMSEVEKFALQVRVWAKLSMKESIE